MIEVIQLNGSSKNYNLQKLEESIKETLNPTCKNASVYLFNNFPLALSAEVNIDLLFILNIPDQNGNYFRIKKNGEWLNIKNLIIPISFIENYRLKFEKEPLLQSIKFIAYIISWNVWQMDGLKGVIPNSCSDTTETSTNLFGHKEITTTGCNGCEKDGIKTHTGIYCLIKDWTKKDKKTDKKGRKIRYVDLLKN